MVVPLHILTNDVWKFQLLQASPTCILVSLKNFSHSSRWVMVFHCNFNLHFPDDWWSWVPFHMSFSHFDMFFSKVPMQVLCPFFCWIVCLFSYGFVVLYKWLICWISEYLLLFCGLSCHSLKDFFWIIEVCNLQVQFINFFL